MSFLSIPSQEGLFTAIKTGGKSSEEAKASAPMHDEENNNDEEDEDEDDGSVRFIPRCSPVPRKRGSSIHDETAEYIRIHLALSAGKRVSFADTTGGDLVDVKEFVAFDSEEEEVSATWEAEEAKYRKPERAPTYRVQPGFGAAAGGALLRAVRANRVEVEQLSPVDNEPLAFCGLVRVLNISYHKAVYIRATMDNWVTYFDHPAEYVQGSNDGDTDQFYFKLSFAPPYITHGSRMEFVVRYETSDGDFWANNSSLNYVITLLLSYEDNSAETNVNIQPARSILKPPKAYSMNDDLDSEDEQEKDEGEEGTSRPDLIRAAAVGPAPIQPEIDVEIPVCPSRPSVPPEPEPPCVDGTLSPHTVTSGVRASCTSPESTPQCNAAFVPCASESVQPNKSPPLPRLHSELGNQTSEQPVDSGPSAPLPSLQESRPRSESSRSGGEEIPSSEDSCLHLGATEMNLWPTGGGGSSESAAGSPRPELPAESISPPAAAEGFERAGAAGSPERVAGLSEDPGRSAAHCEGRAPARASPEAERETEACRDEAPASPELAENRNLVLQSVREHTEDAPQMLPGALSENLPSTLSAASQPPPEDDVSSSLIQPSIAFLTGVVSLSVVMQEPSTLFFIGLLLVLNRL
ncbi:protein phosphatase 1 regulatory subunit 3A isoform X2 [Betta splendens]|uniref:Protein phosphatase 1 regulatory subunit 3A isoform X2 n=1 Tax=Betta splendens TaxID=158456 RepID=A0A8M1HGP9_BETSP|nr:protein phosphatase 1 regulatory subunit 3A isoform X2 [Betta splendens]